MIKKIISCILLIAIPLFTASCNPEKHNYSETTLEYFDTVTTVSGYFKSESDFKKCYNIIEKELENYHKLFDISAKISIESCSARTDKSKLCFFNTSSILLRS